MTISDDDEAGHDWRPAGDQPGPESPWPPEGERTLEQQAQVEVFEKAVAWLRTKWVGDPAPHCPYCQTQGWTVGLPVELSTVDQSGLNTWGAMAPMFPVVCLNCGHTVFVSAVVARLIPEPGSE
jgi:hypothetical protein